MTSNSPPPAPPSADEQPEHQPPTDRPSGLQITASALAAMTTTAVMSTLGVAGTIIGAALASVVTVFANFVYTTSIRRTKEKVSTVVPHRPRPRADDANGSLSEVRPTGRATPSTPDDAPGATPSGSHRADDAASSRLERIRVAVRDVVARMGWRRILAVIAGVFVVVLGAVTVIELAAGKPLAHVVRNEEGAGTSVFGRTSEAPVSPEEDDVPAPEQSPTDMPSPEPTAPGDIPTEQPTAPEPVPEPTAPPAPVPPAPDGDPAGNPEQPPVQPDASADRALEPQPAPAG